ncbi:MAG: nucleotidyltransferase family protein [Bacillota bacterium]|nr:nucleotidyltransferase family protein [Bacillota bacterium]MDD3297415.1 nucleotidyltransferase family protein [Bacillota bacterium]MDD3851176.1 nucleotidyltransferase family protein [Bacillota bacterium]MDD4707184.1 nucleotidyltransferase family protein [Bacillota bacterium]
MVNAIILSGDKNKDLSGGSTKALASIKDRVMIEYVVAALDQSRLVDRIAVVGPEHQLRSYLGDRVSYIVEGVEDLIDNTIIGTEIFKVSPKVLVLTCDIPYLTPEAVDHFVEKSEETGADLCYPIVSKADNELRFPSSRRTYAKLKDGTFTGGNMFYINPQVVERSADIARRLVEYRKKPWKMCSVLGWDFVFRLMAGNLTIAGVEDRLSRLLNIKLAAIISPYPEVGNDVDKESDLLLARQYLGNIG